MVLIDDTAHPIGKLEVQIKTLPAGATSYRCSSSLVAYSQESTTLPVILVCVDSRNTRAYWKQVSELMAGYDRAQQTFTVHFDDALDLINRSDSCPCYHRWSELTEEYRERIQRYPLIVPEAGQQRRVVSLGRPHWEAVQRYADALNGLLDDDFKVVKKLLFPGVWKFGVGSRIIDHEYVLCQLSSIPRGEPAPVIFQLPDEVTPRSFGRNVHTSIVQGRHKFLAGPEQCARDYVFGFVRDLWRAQGFPIFGAEMAADVVLGFVQQYHRWLDLPPDADEYCIEDPPSSVRSGAFTKHGVSRCENGAGSVGNAGRRSRFCGEPAGTCFPGWSRRNGGPLCHHSEAGTRPASARELGAGINDRRSNGHAEIPRP